MERRSHSGPRRGFGPKPPVNQGDVLEVEIEAVGEKGDGIARKDGFVLFVPGVKEGDRVKVKVTRVLRKVGFAEVVGDSAEEQAPAEEAPQEEAPVEAEPEPEPEAHVEDTEDFGEEAPAEETAEEKPAESETPEEPDEEQAPSEEEDASEEIQAPEPPAEEEKKEE